MLHRELSPTACVTSAIMYGPQIRSVGTSSADSRSLPALK